MTRPTTGVQRRRLAAGAAGTVLALTAAIAVPAAGALGSGATAVGPTATTMGPTSGWPTCRPGGPALPLCTPSPTSPTAPSPVGRIDFEDGTTGGWTVTDRRIKLKVVKGAAQEGRLGLRIANLGRVDQPATDTANVRIADGRFPGSGPWREVTLSLRAAKATRATPTITRCGLPYGGPRLTVLADSGGNQAGAHVTLLPGTQWHSVRVQVPAPPAGGDVVLSVALQTGPLTSPVFVDAIAFRRIAVPSPTTTPATSSAPAPVVVQPLCTTR